MAKTLSDVSTIFVLMATVLLHRCGGGEAFLWNAVDRAAGQSKPGREEIWRDRRHVTHSHVSSGRSGSTLDGGAADTSRRETGQETDLMRRVQLRGDMGRCLDGSSPVYYIHHGAAATKWVVFFQGGDWCTRFEQTGVKDYQRSCYARSFSDGSSKRAGPFNSLSGLGKVFGVLSPSAARNPLAHDWNKVYVKYCDGTSFTSARRDALRVHGRPLFFRGKYIMTELIEELMGAQGMARATDLVVAGCSSGALTAYLHAPQWQEALLQSAQRLGRPDTEDIRVAVLADSGFFLHPQPSERGTGDYDFASRMQFMFHELNASASVLPACARSFGEQADRYRCLFAETAVQFSPVPVFTMQSVVDPWQLEWIANNATAEQARGQAHAQRLWEALAATHAQESAPAPRGLYVDACQHHCHCYSDALRVNGASQAQAFAVFYASLRSADAAKQRMWWVQRHECMAQMEEQERGAECPVKHYSWEYR